MPQPLDLITGSRPSARVLRGLLVGLCVTGLGLVVLARQPVRVTLEPRLTIPGSFTSTPINALGNAVDDYVFLSGTGVLVMGRLMGDERRAVWERSFASAVQLAPAMDVDGDGLDEICVSTRDSAGAWVEILARTRDTMCRLGPMRDSMLVPPATGDCHQLPVAVLAGPGGERSLVTYVLTMKHRPRGVALYDPVTSNRRWFFPMGAWPMAAVALAPSGGSPAQLLVGGNSPGNGLDLNGTDDSHACVLALDATGRLLWRTVVAGEFADVALLPLADWRSRPREVVVAVRSHLGVNPEPCALAVLDARTGEMLRNLEFPSSLGQPRLLDAGRGVFVVGCADSTLRTFDGRLEPQGKYRAGAPVEAWGCVDLAGDGVKSVIASTRHEILVLDDRLRLQGRHALESRDAVPTPLAVMQTGLRSHRLLTTRGDIMVLDVSWPIPPLADRRHLIPLARLSLILAVAGAALGPFRRRGRLPTVRESRDFLVDYRQVRHDILDEVRPFGALWNWAHEAVADAPVPLATFEGARDQFLSVGRGTLERFIARAETLRVDPGRLARMRGPLAELERLLRQPAGGPREELAGRARQAASTMRDLSEACAAAYREVAEREPCRADRAVQDALLAQQGRLVQRGVAVHSFVGPGAGVPVLFDAGELRELVGQLVENALAALEGLPGPQLHVSVQFDPLDGRHVVVRVTDNGPGIPVERRETVFQPDQSSRPGGGFGLGHAREVARSWRADLVVDDPPEGRGAAFRLVLAALFPLEGSGAVAVRVDDGPQPADRPEGTA